MQTACPILLVEQNASMALSLCDHGYIMENGQIVLGGNGPSVPMRIFGNSTWGRVAHTREVSGT